MPPDSTVWIADDIGLIDLWFQGNPRVIGVYLFDLDSGFALVETGPASGHQRLLDGIRALGRDPRDLRAVLLTHIHLDHSGGVGTLLADHPEIDVFVHEIGAPHLIDPTNLLRSAERIYGDAMDTLWGATLPVPAERVTWVRDGDVISVGGRELAALYTPGHASHHVAYHERRSGVVVAGDVAGVRIPPATRAWPPTPPPDINVELWHASVARLRACDPTTLLISHFGVVAGEQIGPHLDDLEQHLDDWVALVATEAARGRSRDEIVERLQEHTLGDLHAEHLDDLADSFAMATPYGMSVDGLLRYLRKREEQR